MTKLLYLDDAYLKTCSATVTHLLSEQQVILDKTIFYPQGGGQPYDKGTIKSDKNLFHVIKVIKKEGQVIHEVSEPGLQPGDHVTLTIDWDRRYHFMRSHTAAHLLSAVFHTDYGCLITGNQLSEEKIRIDFNLEQFDRALIERAINKTNMLIKEDLPVTTSYLPREEAEKDPSLIKLAKALPPVIDQLRIISIGDVDQQADGGTHVHSTKEVGQLTLLKLENKGARNRRVSVTLAPLT